ncbi:hypothetical protein LIER_06368 [Lithospermum erythrorhizon]|uniref:Uncharacterized protein n=1 Tax=Lithospermum erythrorhizon TaxID=34254 RepID=A0AAV3P4Z7_LITER
MNGGFRRKWISWPELNVSPEIWPEKVAGELRDREMDVKVQITAVIDKSKQERKTEAEFGDGGVLVTESDIQHMVSKV